MPTRKTKPAPAAAARFQGGNSSAAVNYIKAEPAPAPRVLTEEELAALEEEREDDRERQRQQVAPPPGMVLRSVRFGGPKYEHPVPPKPTAAQRKAKAEQEEQRKAREAIALQKAAEEAVKAKAQAAIQQEQNERLMAEAAERHRAMWGTHVGPAVLSRKNSPSFKGKR